MKNVTISLDESLLKKCREYAAKKGMSLNALIRLCLAKQVGAVSNNWTEEFFRIADQVRPDSKGKKWTRDELYRG